MEAERYVFLDFGSGSRSRDGGFAPRDAAEAPKLEVAELTPSEAAKELQKPGRVGARPMPIALIEPMDAEDDGASTGGPGATWGVQAVGADASDFTGAGIKVAVLDTGIDANHPAFAGATVTQEDFTTSGLGDTNGHGTHCAGTIAGREVDGFRFGVAPGVPEILAGKVLGEGGGTSEVLLKAMAWARDNGANVISMSLGIDFPGAVQENVEQLGMPIPQATSRALDDYRRNLRLFGSFAEFLEQGSLDGFPVLVVAATGNESERAAPEKPYTVAISPPAASEGFIGVAALGEGPDSSLVVAPFSNTGGAVAGPGVKVVSAKTGGGFKALSGTSMATPHVAGVAALWAESIMQQTGNLTTQTLSSKLLGNCRFDPGFDANDVGAGLAQAP